MPKFFVDSSYIRGTSARIYGSDVRHITKVLRLGVQSVIILCDGEGFDYVARISEVDRDFILLDILEKKECRAEPKLKVTLFQGIPKGSKMEYIIEKCTELGVDSIVPVMMERTVMRLDGDDSKQKKPERWRKIASESVKQCARGAIPMVYDIYDLHETAGLLKCLDLLIVAYEQESIMTLKQVLKSNKTISSLGIFIGPEGGFAQEEIEFLKASGVQPVTLGNRILRTETAGHAALSAIMYEFDEMQ